MSLSTGYTRTNGRQTATLARAATATLIATLVFFAAHFAAAKKKTVTVTGFRGPGSGRIRAYVMRTLRRTHRLAPIKKYVRTARRLGVKISGSRNIRRVCKKASIDAVIFGRILRSRGRWWLRLYIKGGRTGRTAKRAVIRLYGPCLNASSRRDIRKALQTGMSKVRFVTPPKSSTSPRRPSRPSADTSAGDSPFIEPTNAKRDRPKPASTRATSAPGESDKASDQKSNKAGKTKKGNTVVKNFEGFFFRTTLGLSYAHLVGGGMGGSASLGGVSAPLEIDIGGIISGRFALSFQLSGLAALSPAGTFGVVFRAGLTGTYYLMPSAIFFTGSVRLPSLGALAGYPGVGAGLGVQFGAGREWRLSRSWWVGVMGQAFYDAMLSLFLGFLPTGGWNVVGGGISVVFSYHKPETIVFPPQTKKAVPVRENRPAPNRARPADPPPR